MDQGAVGSVTGYVYTKYIITGEEAWQRADEIMSESSAEHITEAVPCAESREEEEARLAEERKKAEEEATRQAAEQAANVSTLGQQIVDYACQFIGNPYVWGGTSLTNGADCSGFVQSVYEHFGINLPRTTWDQEYSGTGISYEEAMPGDLILYEGHVGIYIGNDQIVNAINPSKGIGIIPATCMSIKTVRRVDIKCGKKCAWFCTLFLGNKGILLCNGIRKAEMYKIHKNVQKWKKL